MAAAAFDRVEPLGVGKQTRRQLGWIPMPIRRTLKTGELLDPDRFEEQQMSLYDRLMESTDQVKAGKPFHKYGIEWLFKRGERPVVRSGYKKGDRQSVKSVWVVYANGSEVAHGAEPLKKWSVWLDNLGQLHAGRTDADVAAEVDKMAKDRVREHATWQRIYPDRVFA